MAYLTKHPQSQYWQAAFYDVNGKRRNASTKIKALESLRKKAQNIADKYEEAAQNKRTVNQVRRVIADLTAEISGALVPEVTLRAHVAGWLDRKKPEVAPSTYSFYKGTTAKFLEYASEKNIADRDIALVTRHHITEYRNELTKRVRPQTVNHHIKGLRMLFKDARKEGLLVDDPTEFVDAVRSTSERVRRPFTIDEIQTVLMVVNEEWQSLVKFGFYTGQRLGDLAALTWANIDVQKKTLRLVTAKTGKPLTIPLSDALLAHIGTLPTADQPDAPLHSHANGVLETQNGTKGLSNEFADILYLCGLRAKKVEHKSGDKGRSSKRTQHELSFHSLRHSAVTLLHEAGVPEAVSQSLIGHDSQEVHQQYVTVGREALEDASKIFPIL